MKGMKHLFLLWYIIMAGGKSLTLLRITIFGGFVRMKKSRIKYLFFLIAYIGFWLLACPVISGQIIINSKDQFEFAGSCMEKGEYEQAAREFE